MVTKNNVWFVASDIPNSPNYHIQIVNRQNKIEWVGKPVIKRYCKEIRIVANENDTVSYYDCYVNDHLLTA